MKRLIIFMVAQWLLIGILSAKEIKGYVRAEGKALPSVLVTDGYSVTETDARGRFTLEVHPKAEFVSVVQPAGYQVACREGMPVFYLPVEKKQKSYDFELQALPVSDRYVLLAIADPQPQNDRHFGQFKSQAVPDLEQTIKSYPANTPVFGITLGDIVWDAPGLYAAYKQEMARLNIPFFQVIGNHDHDLNTPSVAKSETRYKNEFGPNYYAFCLGKDYYIVLDNIVYEGQKVYTTTLEERQIAWLKTFLSHVPKGASVVLAMHAPFFKMAESNGTRGADQVKKLLQDYQVQILSGHTHININREEAGIFEHNVASIGGAWWAYKTSKDGTPKGYQVFEVEGDRWHWFYKACGKDKKYQLQVYPQGKFDKRVNAVVAKVWNWDPAWKVEWKEDGKPMGAMEQFTSLDPDYVRFAVAKKVKPYKAPIESDFYFAATPSVNAREVTVVVTDRFGEVYKKKIKLNAIDVEAHRGGIGLMPENTIPAMLHAIQLGVNTLEMDMSVSKDKKIVVSHDPYMNRNFVTKPDGKAITKGEEKSLALYTMTYDSIRKYETGLKVYPKYPKQKKLKTYKPLISDLIDSVEAYTRANQLSPMYYNIEVKSSVKNDKVYSPEYKEFVDLAIPLLLAKGITDRLMVQCFDVRALNYMHQKYPQLTLSYLVGKDKSDFEAAMAELEFVPQVYSPNYALVNEELIKQVHAKGMKILPWTVDKEEDIARMVELKVDGIISNYPDRVLKQVRK